MYVSAVAFGVALACSVLLTPLAIRLAGYVGAIDRVGSSRKVHTAPIPRLGGLAVAGAFFIATAFVLLSNAEVLGSFHRDALRQLGFCGGALAICALGVYDDLKGTNATIKLAVQFAVGAFAYLVGFRIDELANPFGASVQLGWVGLPFTMLWIAGVINAINLIDGLDGLAGGVALVAVAVTFVFAAFRAEPLMMLFSAALAGALLGFLRYNFNPAKIFMGDSGSLFLGFVLATTSIETHQKSSTTVAILLPIIVLGVPITDTLLAMTRRALCGAPIFVADRGHIHHRLLERGLSQRATTLLLWGASVALGAVALALASASSFQAGLLLAFLAALAAVALHALGYVRLATLPRVLEERRRNLGRRATLREVGARLRSAAELGQVWATVKDAGPRLGASTIALRLTAGDLPHPAGTQHFAHAVEGAGRIAGTTTLELRGGGAVESGRLELGWATSGPPDRATELALEALARSVEEALRRVGRNGAAGAELPAPPRRRSEPLARRRPRKGRTGRASETSA